MMMNQDSAAQGQWKLNVCQMKNRKKWGDGTEEYFKSGPTMRPLRGKARQLLLQEGAVNCINKKIKGYYTEEDRL